MPKVNKENSSSLIIKIDSKDLIDQVEQRPALYDPNHPDRDLIPDYRDVLWREICQTLVPNWSNQKTVEQNETVHELQKKWRNLKDCFRKDYRRLLNKKEGEKIKRKYKNYDRLKFLLPVIREQYKQDRKKKKIMIMTGYRKNLNCADLSSDNDNESGNDVYSNIKPNRIDSPKMDDLDEDKHFLLSLVPAFKRMDHEQKLTARIEILNVLRNIQCLNRSYLNDTSSLNGQESLTLCAATKVKIEHIEDLDNDTHS